jgi:hypothetical protein
MCVHAPWCQSPHCQSFHPKTSLIHIYRRIPTSLGLFTRYIMNASYAMQISSCVVPVSLVLHSPLYPPSQPMSCLVSPHYHHPLTIVVVPIGSSTPSSVGQTVVFLTRCEIALTCKEIACIRILKAYLALVSDTVSYCTERRAVPDAKAYVISNEPDS